MEDGMTRMSAETQNLVADLVKAWNDYDVERVEGFYAADCEEIDVALAEPLRGAPMIRKLMKYYLRGFPDVRVTVEQVVCNDTQAALLWTLQGTHGGYFMNIPPTGRRVS